MFTGFIKQLEIGNILGAAQIISESSTLPAVCGRVCPQEKQCEAQCIHLKMGKEAVAIGYLERFVADNSKLKVESPALKVGKSAEESKEGFTVMKGVLSNLATDVIRSVIDGIKQLGQAFVDVGKEAVSSYAEFEQLEGGVKKIFGDDMAQAVIENSQNAFKTAGLSANEYMETVTGFSASLIQSLGGDTEKAVEVSDRAIRDMSDNANTFGTDMASTQALRQLP